MKYTITQGIALRGWRLVPHAYYIRGGEYAQGLTRDEFEVLKKCDGETEIPSSPVLDSLLARGLCAAENGERPTKTDSRGKRANPRISQNGRIAARRRGARQRRRRWLQNAALGVPLLRSFRKV